MALDRKTGQDGLAARRARSRAARAVARRQRHVGVQLARHRRRAALRLLRVVRDLRLRPERQAALGEGPRRQAHAERVRRGLDARDPRQHDGHRLGSSERRVVRRRARHARWQGAVAAAPQGDRHLGDAADPRRERPAAGDRARHGTCPQLRPGHRPGGLGERRADDEHDSVAGPRGRARVPDERLPRQRSEGGARRRRQGQHRRHQRHRLDASIATRRTCRRRSCSTACCTS